MLNLNNLLENVKTVGISGHVHPDGDCVGSCLGLWLYLRTYYPQIQAEVFLEDFSDSFQFLEGSSCVVYGAPDRAPFDLFFSLDCGDETRLGEHLKYFREAGKTVCVDHHVTNKAFADENYVVPEASSTSELICDLIGTEKVTASMAEALYMGIVHDTGVFQFSCTSSKTMRLAGELMDKGIDYPRIVQDTFYTKTYLQEQILGRALLESIRMLDGRVIFSALRQKDLDFFGVQTKDLDGIVSVLRNTQGVDVAIFLYETGLQEYKVSMRSSVKVDVSTNAAYFGGGGHARAAGCTMQGSVYDVVNNLVRHICAQLDAV